MLTSLWHYAQVVWPYTRAHLGGLLTVTAIASVTESVGIVLFLPLLTSADLHAAGDDRLSHFLHELFTRLGYQPGIPSLLLLIFSLFLFKGAVLFLQGIYRGALSARITRRVRSRTVNLLGSLDYQRFIDREGGFFTNLVTMEASRMVGAFNVYCHVIITLMTIAVYLLFSLWINWPFTLATIVFGTATLYLMRGLSRLTKTYSIERSREYSTLHNLLIQMLEAFKYIQATRAFTRLQDRLQGHINRLAQLQFKTLLWAGLSTALAEPLIILFVCALILYQFAVVQGSLAPIIVSLLFFYRIMQRVMSLQNNWQQFSSFIGSVDTMQCAIEEMTPAEAAGPPAMCAGLGQQLTIQQVHFNYGATPVLQGIDLTLPANTTIALAGVSGVGKTTLVDLLCGVLHPATGTITIDGRPLDAALSAAWQERVGYVTQEPVVFSDTVANNISLWQETNPQAPAIVAAAQRAHCDEFIRQLPEGYATHIGDRGVKRSGGQRQRVAIARELYRRPALLILDEATSALDAASEIAIQQSLEELKGQLTIVIIAHRLSTLRAADRIYVLHDGRVAEQGTFTELADQPDSLFQRMWQLQQSPNP